MKKVALVGSVSILLALTVSQVAAETEFSVGAAAVVMPDYLGSDDYEVTAYPLVDLSWSTDEEIITQPGEADIGVGLYAVGIGTTSGLYAEIFRAQFGNHRFSETIGFGFDGDREESDNVALRGLGDIDPYVTGFAKLAYEPVEPEGAFFLTGGLGVEADLSGETDSLLVQAEIAANHLLSEAFFISHGPQITWANGNHMASYFGVNAQQALRSGYQRFEAGSGIRDAGYSISAGYEITDDLSVLAGAEYARLFGDAADSPTVRLRGSEDVFGVHLGLQYRLW